MSETLNNKKSQDGNDGVDLFDFARIAGFVGRAFTALGTAIMYTVVFLLRKWLWIGLSLAIGIGVSYFMKHNSERQYTSEIIFRSNTIPNADMITHINKLHTFCQEKNMSALAQALNVSEEQVRHIGDIQAFWVIDLGNDGVPDFVDYRNRHNVSDTVNVRMRDRFVVRVKTTIPTQLGAIRDGIMHFVESNTFFQQQNKLRLTQTESILARIESDISRLDSLQQVKYFEESRMMMPRDGGQMIFMQEQKTQLLHEDILGLYRQRNHHETVITIHPGLITMLSDFTPPAKPVNGALYYGKVVIPAIFILTVILLLLFDNRRKIRDVIKKY